MIAMLAGESDAAELADRLGTDIDRLYSAVSAWETIAGLCRSHGLKLQAAREIVDRFLHDFRFRCVALGEREMQLATDAYADYGKGRHPAALNMGDCFAYACANANRARLLYKGGNFTKTDLA